MHLTINIKDHYATLDNIDIDSIESVTVTGLLSTYEVESFISYFPTSYRAKTSTIDNAYSVTFDFGSVYKSRYNRRKEVIRRIRSLMSY